MLNEKRLNELGFKLSNLNDYDSFVHDCKFYSHVKLDSLVLTDYDVLRKEPLKSKYMFFYNYKGDFHFQLFSTELLQDTLYFDKLLNLFLIEILSHDKRK